MQGTKIWPQTGRLLGTLEPSVSNVSQLWTPGPVKFNCSVFLGMDALTLCQVSYLSPFFDSYEDNGSLLPEFWDLMDPENALGQGLQLWSRPILVVQSRNITPNPDFSNVTFRTQSRGQWTSVSTPQQVWNMSICYSSWVTADLNVTLYSHENRTEPVAFWSQQQGYYTQPNVHEQLGNVLGNSTPESRGILQLAEKASWIPSRNNTIANQIQPFVQQFADTTSQGIQGFLSLPYTCADCSALIARPDQTAVYQSYDPSGMFHVDFSLVSLFQQALSTGSLARAISSLITTLSSMAYYDQMPQFERTSRTTQVFFTTVLFPRSHTGFWTVMIVLAFHSLLVACIVVAFTRHSRHTLLGNYWQSIAQLLGAETRVLLSDGRGKTDGRVREEIVEAGDEGVKVGVRVLGGKSGMVGLRRVGGDGVNVWNRKGSGSAAGSF